MRLLQLLLATSIVVPLALFALLAWQAWARIGDSADERLTRSLDVLAEQAARTFQSVELAFVLAHQMLRGMDDADVSAREGEVHARLLEVVKAVPAVDSVWVLGKAGEALATSRFLPVPNRGPVAADRDYFKAQLDRNRGLFIGEVLQPRLVQGSPPFIALSERRTAPDGSFAGVIQVSLLPQSLSRFYSTLGRGFPEASFALIRADGAMLAWHPVLAEVPPKLGPGSSFQQQIQSNPEGALYTTRSPYDGIDRRIGIRKVGNLPLYVSAGLSLPSLRNAWLLELAEMLAFGIPAALAIWLLVLAVMRRTSQLYAAIEQQGAAEDALRQAQKMEAIGQLTGGVAHDFNNMLAVIIGGLDLAIGRLKRGETDIVRYLDLARDGANRATDLTRRLLSFARRAPLEPAVLDLNSVVKGMAELLYRALGEHIQLETVLAGGLWRARSDPGQIESALLNLAVNARDAMPKGGNLTIETSNASLDEEYARLNADVRPGQYVLIAVTDTGIGMSEDVLSRAFEPFFTTKKAGQGSGLGLSQVYGFAKQSGGHLKIYSELGRGTTVKLYLPRDASGQRAEAAVADGAALPIARPGETVLVVEDESGVRRTSVLSLRDLGYDVLEASSAEEAIPIFEKEQGIDLLFTDVVMPGMSGRELSDVLRSKRPDLKVIFTTGYTRNAIVHNNVVDEGVDLLLKPFTLSQLARQVRRVLDR